MAPARIAAHAALCDAMSEREVESKSSDCGRWWRGCLYTPTDAQFKSIARRAGSIDRLLRGLGCLYPTDSIQQQKRASPIGQRVPASPRSTKPRLGGDGGAAGRPAKPPHKREGLRFFLAPQQQQQTPCGRSSVLGRIDRRQPDGTAPSHDLRPSNPSMLGARSIWGGQNRARTHIMLGLDAVVDGSNQPRSRNDQPTWRICFA